MSVRRIDLVRASHEDQTIRIFRPRMRGRLHLYAFGVAVVCAVVLCALAAARPGWTPFVAYAVYSTTVCGLFGVSALYHRRTWEPHRYLLMKRLDHSMIFVFIAGTYTPFCVLLLEGATARGMLAAVWGGALAGIALKMWWPRPPRWLSVSLYLILGWIALVVLPEILGRGGPTMLVLLLAGGVLYSIGALFYAFKWPDPWPQTFGYHEFFHAATVLAAACHHVAAYFALFA